MGLPMSQYDKDDMDPMGMLKLDVLGVRMQSAMAYAIREIERTQNRHIELDEIPKDDAKTFELIRTTNTLGIFQIESPLPRRTPRVRQGRIPSPGFETNPSRNLRRGYLPRTRASHFRQNDRLRFS
jgi:DNA polymerase III alpha subunit (gram-positive type)